MGTLLSDLYLSNPPSPLKVKGSHPVAGVQGLFPPCSHEAAGPAGAEMAPGVGDLVDRGPAPRPDPAREQQLLPGTLPPAPALAPSAPWTPAGHALCPVTLRWVRSLGASASRPWPHLCKSSVCRAVTETQQDSAASAAALSLDPTGPERRGPHIGLCHRDQADVSIPSPPPPPCPLTADVSTAVLSLWSLTSKLSHHPPRETFPGHCGERARPPGTRWVTRPGFPLAVCPRQDCSPEDRALSPLLPCMGGGWSVVQGAAAPTAWLPATSPHARPQRMADLIESQKPCDEPGD